MNIYEYIYVYLCPDRRQANRVTVGALSPVLTELPLEFTQAAQRGGDEVSILALDVLQNVFPVQTDGFRYIHWTVQVSQQSAT